MILHEIVKTSQKLLADNSPAILTAIGVTGTVTTAYLAGKAAYKANNKIAYENFKGTDPNYEDNFKCNAKLTWKLYIPAVSSGALTISSIIIANRIGSRRTAAMAAAFSISEKAFSEYKDKVIEKIGPNKELKVRDEVAQDRVTKDSVGKHEVLVTGGGEVLCYEALTGRYFNSSMETIKKAENDINYTILHDMYASLSDFYNKLGLSHTKLSDEVGWNTDHLLDLNITTTISDDNRPCLYLDFKVDPIRNYFRLQ